MKKVQILMSTYNGERYLKEQIDSILAQDCEQKNIAQLKLLVRDDGSKDKTQEILTEYADQYPDKIEWYQGDNVGVIKSFFDLMKHAEDVDYYSFSDQDDFWLPEKVGRAVESLEELSSQSDMSAKPILYACRPKLVDGELQDLESAIKRPAMRPGFGNALVENIVTGCTAVMNKTLRDMVTVELPKFTVMHDWWFYIVASCFGKVYYDENSYILYRQHSGNVVGSNTSRIAELKERIRRFKGNRRNISNQIGEFVRIFETTAAEYKHDGQTDRNWEMAQELLRGRTSFSVRRRLVKSNQIYRQRHNDDRIFRLILLSGSF